MKLLLKVILWIAFCTIIYIATGCQSANHVPRYQHNYKVEIEKQKFKHAHKQTNNLFTVSVVSFFVGYFIVSNSNIEK